MGRYRVALIHNIIAPYRVPLFEALSKHPSIDLTVFFCAKTHKIRKWDIPEESTYKNEVLSGITVEFGEYVNHFNPLIIWRLLQGDFDIIIVGGYSDLTMQIGFLTAKLLDIPVILWSEGTEGTQTLLGKVLDPLTKLMITRATTLMVPGTLSRDFHIKRGAPAEKIFIAPNIVDTDTFFEKSSAYKKHKALFKHDQRLGENTIVLFVGQLIRRKGVEFLIQAFARLRREREDIVLVLVGDGELKSELNQRISSENMEDIIFTGWVSEEEKIKYYAIADLFVLPTLRDLCPLVLNEAMACSLPVVSTTAAGCARDMIVDGENGFIVEPRNVDALYEAIRRVMQDNELMQTMGKKSYEILTSRFSIDRAVNGWLNAIQFACQGSCDKSH